MKKTALALALISALLFSVVGAHFASLAEANPYMMYQDVDPPPGTVPTRITILSPRNSTEYSSKGINVTIRATGPQPPTSKESGIYWSNFNIDNAIFRDIKKGWDLLPEVSYSEIFYNLPVGDHKLTVFAYGLADLGNMQGFIMYCNSTVYFSVSNTSSSPSPSPSPLFIATPELIPTPTPTPESESLPTSLVMASSVTAAVVLVGIGLLLYGIKRK